MKDIKTRIAKAKGIMAGLNSIWQSKRVDYKTKMRILKSCVWSVGLYACETWTLNKSHQDRLLAFEMYCYRRVLKLNWTHKVTNIEVRRRLNIKENIIQTIIKRKMALFGHICRMDNDRKIKTVMLGEMDGTGRRGRPNREWLDDIRDWGQRSVHRLSNMAMNRTEWRHIVNSAVDTYGLLAYGHWTMMMMMMIQ